MANNKSKDNKKGSKPEEKKAPKAPKKEGSITLSDVKAANTAVSKSSSIDFPSDAPVKEVSESQKGNSEWNEFPADAPVTTNTPETSPDTATISDEKRQSDPYISTPPNDIASPPNASDSAANENTDVNPETPNDEITAPTEPVVPTQDEMEEIVFEKWWNGKNRPTEINHFELANDINMNRFSAYEAMIGKFKFKRSHAGANWEITVDDKK